MKYAGGSRAGTDRIAAKIQIQGIQPSMHFEKGI